MGRYGLGQAVKPEPGAFPHSAIAPTIATGTSPIKPSGKMAGSSCSEQQRAEKEPR